MVTAFAAFASFAIGSGIAAFEVGMDIDSEIVAFDVETDIVVETGIVVLMAEECSCSAEVSVVEELAAMVPGPFPEICVLGVSVLVPSTVLRTGCPSPLEARISRGGLPLKNHFERSWLTSVYLHDSPSRHLILFGQNSWSQILASGLSVYFWLCL